MNEGQGQGSPVLRRVALAAVLLIGADGAQAVSFDAGYPASSLNSVSNPVSLLPDGQTAIARTEMFTGTQAIVLSFVVPDGMPGANVQVTLTDLGWPGGSNLSLAVTTSEAMLAQLAAPGSLNFFVNGPGSYFATVYGVADPGFGVGLYSLNLSCSPVPLPTAAVLLVSGLLWLRRQRRAGKQAVTNAG